MNSGKKSKPSRFDALDAVPADPAWFGNRENLFEFFLAIDDYVGRRLPAFPLDGTGMAVLDGKAVSAPEDVLTWGLRRVFGDDQEAIGAARETIGRLAPAPQPPPPPLPMPVDWRGRSGPRPSSP